MAHYYDEKPQGPVIEEEFTQNIAGRPFNFVAASGLFSKKHMDKATILLIEKCDLEGAKTVLDLGCGWGGVVTVLGSQRPDIEFTATDVNERAIEYTKKNAKKYHVKANIVRSDVFASIQDAKFDVILTNPPYVAGRELCYRFITESFDHLNKGGSLQLVARHQKGGKMLEKKMEETFGNVEALAKGSGFRIYKSVKN